MFSEVYKVKPRGKSYMFKNVSSGKKGMAQLTLQPLKNEIKHYIYILAVKLTGKYEGRAMIAMFDP